MSHTPTEWQPSTGVARDHSPRLYSSSAVSDCVSFIDMLTMTFHSADTVPPAQRVDLHQPSPAPSTAGVALLLTFTINQLDLVKKVQVDIEEQDSNFAAFQTLNYTLSEDVYKGGRVCVTALSEEAHYVVCLRVIYSDIGEDSSCSRVGPVEKGQGTAVSEQCQQPTSSRRVTGGTESRSQASELSVSLSLSLSHTHTHTHTHTRAHTHTLQFQTGGLQ